MSVGRIGFGTSTFVAGRLSPDKDSDSGIATLVEAIKAGLRVIHSNPNLGTQWAIRRALELVPGAPSIRHLIKIEVPLGVSPAEGERLISAGLSKSLGELAVLAVDGVVLELDLKRTVDRALLTDPKAIAGFYQNTAQRILATGQTTKVIGYCHSPSHLLASLRADALAGCAAQYNLVEAWPALYLDRVAAEGRAFIGMAPLGRGTLVNGRARAGKGRLYALRWALAHPAVSQVLVTMSTLTHLRQVLYAASSRLPVQDVQSHASRWKSAGQGLVSRPVGR